MWLVFASLLLTTSSASPSRPMVRLPEMCGLGSDLRVNPLDPRNKEPTPAIPLVPLDRLQVEPADRPVGWSCPVWWVQHRLDSNQIPTGPIDGKVGPETRAAVRAFQRTHGLAVDGVAGKQTCAALAWPLR